MNKRARIKDARHESALFRTRAIAGFLLIVACLSLLGARFFYLQVTRHDEFSSRLRQSTGHPSYPLTPPWRCSSTIFCNESTRNRRRPITASL